MPLHLNQSDTPDRVHYIAPDPAKVQGFLTQHQHVEALLHDAQRPLQHAFGKDVTVSIAVVNNPDVAPGEVLVRSVQASLSAVKALARLDAFDEKWWLDNAPRANGQLIFTLAPQ